MTLADTIQCALARKSMRACTLTGVMLITNFQLIRQDDSEFQADCHASD